MTIKHLFDESNMFLDKEMINILKAQQFFLKIFYCCLIIVVPIFPHYPPLPYPTLTSHIQSSLPFSLSMGPLYIFLDLTLSLISPIIPLHPPLWSLSVCSYPCLWLYFARLFVMFISFPL